MLSGYRCYADAIFFGLCHYPTYTCVHGLFSLEPVVSIVVEVSQMLPIDEVLIKVEAKAFSFN